jgi:hypothetical protein
MPITFSNTEIIFNNQPCGQTTAYCNPVGSSITRYYTASGPGTWPRPNITGENSLKAIKVTVVGAGGPNAVLPGPGAEQGAGGGAGGGAAIKYYPGPSIPGPQPYVVGTSLPGPGVTQANGTSSFGAAPLTVVSATAGDSGSSIYAGINAGSGSGGDVNFTGGAGTQGLRQLTPISFNAVGGQGGSSIFGGGGRFISPGTPALSTVAYGAGGHGGVNPGGPAISPTPPSVLVRGGEGIVIVEEFY